MLQKNLKNMSPEQKKELLRSRAVKLAQSVDAEASNNNIIEILEFQLSNERYAFESLFVREVYPLHELTWLPSVPSYVRGIVNIRRKIYSVVDLRVLFELPVKENTRFSKIIILEKNDIEFAIIAENINDVRTIALSEIQASLPTLTGVREEFLKGVTADGLVVLDGEKLLTDKKLVVEHV